MAQRSLRGVSSITDQLILLNKLIGYAVMNYKVILAMNYWRIQYYHIIFKPVNQAICIFVAVQIVYLVILFQ